MKVQDLSGVRHLLGTNIRVSQFLNPEPKLKLSPLAPVSAQFRVEMDQWLLARFGVNHPYYVAGGEFIISQAIYEQLIKELK